MNITREDAASALKDVEAVTARSREARAYRLSGPHLMLWGVIWIVGYSLTGLMSHGRIGLLWLGLTAVGFLGALLLARREAAALRGAEPRQANGRGAAVIVGMLAFLAFMGAVYGVMRPTLAAQYEVLPALVLGLVYVVTGAGRAWRFVAIGTAIFSLSLLGYFLLQPWLAYWLAAVGGGGLILGGLWLGRA